MAKGPPFLIAADEPNVYLSGEKNRSSTILTVENSTIENDWTMDSMYKSTCID